MPKKRSFSLAQRQAQMAARWAPRQTKWGRPPKPLDFDKMYELAFLGYRNSEIAHSLGCDARTLARHAELIAFARNRARARHSLALFHVAVAEKQWPVIAFLLRIAAVAAAGEGSPRPLSSTDSLAGRAWDHEQCLEEDLRAFTNILINLGFDPGLLNSRDREIPIADSRPGTAKQRTSLAARQQEMKSRWRARPRRGGARRKLDAEQVSTVAYAGMSDGDIARQLGCDRRTLRAHCATALSSARQRAQAEQEADLRHAARWLQVLDRKSWTQELAAPQRWLRNRARRELSALSSGACIPFVGRTRRRPKARTNSRGSGEQTNDLNQVALEELWKHLPGAPGRENARPEQSEIQRVGNWLIMRFPF